jgi:hypothetical protein
MKKLAIAAAFAAIAAPAFAQYGGGYGGGGYYAPRYRTVCTIERVFVPEYGGYYGAGYYVNRRVCRQVRY